MNTCQSPTVQILDTARSGDGAFRPSERRFAILGTTKLGFTSIGTVVAAKGSTRLISPWI